MACWRWLILGDFAHPIGAVLGSGLQVPGDPLYDVAKGQRLYSSRLISYLPGYGGCPVDCKFSLSGQPSVDENQVDTPGVFPPTVR